MKVVPKISIIMNCYNSDEYLRIAINSICKQTFTNWELIFWDNQSTDTSAQIFQSYDDNRFKYFYSPTHTNLYTARNFALEKAVGEYITFLDCDDYWHPTKLEVQLKHMIENDAQISYSQYSIIDENNSESVKLNNSKATTEFKTFYDLAKRYDVGLLTIMIRRTLLLEAGLKFDGRYHIIGDFAFIMTSILTTPILSIAQPLANYRLHPNSETAKNLRLLSVEFTSWFNEIEYIKRTQPKSYDYLKSKKHYFSGLEAVTSRNYALLINESLRIKPIKWKLKLLMFVLFRKL